MPETLSESDLFGYEKGAFSRRAKEKQAIIRSLRRWKGNRTRAAEALSISRRTLITKIAEYEISE